MKSFTKLAVLLLTLALLCTSVFAITAFANEAATVSTSDSISREGVVSIFDAAKGIGEISAPSKGRLTENYYKLGKLDDETGRYTITNNAPETAATDAKSTSYVNMSYLNNVQFDYTSYLLASLRIGTDDSCYLMDEAGNGLVSLQFVIRKTTDSSAVSSTGIVYIVPEIAEDKSVTWWLCNGNNASVEGVKKYCEVDEDFTLDVVLETVEKDNGKRNCNLHIYVDDVHVGTSELNFSKDYTYTNQYRVSLTNSDHDDDNFTTKRESIWFDNCAIDAVSGSSATNGIDLAYLFKNGAPTTTNDWAKWETILYSVYDADGTRTYEGSEIVCTNGAESYTSTDPFRTAMNSSSSAIVALKRDVTYKNKTSAADKGASLFSIPNAAVTKTIYFNGCTLLHAPYYDNAGVETATQGQMFYFTGTSARTINFDGGYNAFGVKGTLARSAKAQCMFRGPSTEKVFQTDCGVTLNFADVTVNSGVVTVEQSGTGYFTDGMLGGATWNFTNSELINGNSTITFVRTDEGDDNKLYHDAVRVDFVNSTLTLSKRPLIKKTAVSFDGCEVNVTYTGGQGSTEAAGSQTYGMFEDNADSSIYAKNTAFNANPYTWEYYKDVDGAITLTKGAYHTLGSSGSATYTIDEGCRASNSSTIRYSKNTYAPGVILYRDPADPDNTYTRKIDLFANLTLASDITYNLYIPTWLHNPSQTNVAYAHSFTVGDLTVNYAEFTEDKIITLDDGSEYFVYKVDFPAHEAFNDKTLTFQSQYLTTAKLDVTNTLSITNYVNTVLTNANNSEEYKAAYGLMADLVDYVNASATYFEESVSEEFAALSNLANYTDNATQNNTIPASETKRDSLGEYISGSELNLEASNVKFKFNVAKAGEFTYSYVSADGTKVIKTATYKAGEVIEVSMRAYDLNAVITISVGDLSDDYDLAAYAGGLDRADEDEAKAYALVVEMYNYAKSAEAYKKSLLAAANN